MSVSEPTCHTFFYNESTAHAPTKAIHPTDMWNTFHFQLLKVITAGIDLLPSVLPTFLSLDMCCPILMWLFKFKLTTIGEEKMV